MYIDVADQKKHGVRDYLDLISAYALENEVNSFNRKEYIGNKLTILCIGYIAVCVSNQIHIPSVVR